MQIMLKDMADSKRLNTAIQQLTPDALAASLPLRGRQPLLPELSATSATIASALFWPPLEEEPLKLPHAIQV